jgi:hypothetical protein
VVPFDVAGPEAVAAEQVTGMDVFIICCLVDESPLISIAKKAGVKRYIPCFYATVMPRGVQSLRDNVSQSRRLVTVFGLEHSYTKLYSRKRL